MVSIQFEEKNNESSEVTAYFFTVLAVPSPSLISSLLEEKLKEDLYLLYPDSDSPFAVEVEIDQVNDKRQSMFIEVRIKDGGDLNEISLSGYIKKAVETLSSANL